MKLILIFLTKFICLFFVFQSANCQDFGDFDFYVIKNENKSVRQLVDSYDLSENLDWDTYKFTDVSDGYYKEYYFTLNSEIKPIKMEGEIANGQKVGTWKLYARYSNLFYIGEFKNNLKNGLWLGYYVDNQLDTVIVDSLFFENDKIYGERKEYSYNREIQKVTNYFNNEKIGKQKVYRMIYSKNEMYLSEIRNYKNNILDGIQIEFDYLNPLDTMSFAEYSEGKLNGLFYEKSNYNDEKTYINYSMNRLEGSYKKYYGNGILQFDLEFKNNLPYTLYANNDTLGNPIDTNKFVNGTGVLNIYNDLGNLQSSFTYENQLLNGEFKVFYNNGKLSEKGFLYGSLDSVYSKVDTYKRQELNLYSAWQMRFISNSESMSFFENGSLQCKGVSIFNEELNTYIMLYKCYDVNGFLAEEYTTAYRLNFGKFIEYYSNGNVKSVNNHVIKSINDSIGSFLEGKSLYYYENGNIRAELNLKNGKEVGVSKFYNVDSKLVRKKVTNEDGSSFNVFKGDTLNVTDSNGLKQGKWISLKESKFFGNYDNETPYEIQYFLNDRPIGEWVNYYTFNLKSKNKKYNLRQKLIWQNDTVSYCREWYPNGRIKSEGYLLNFEKDGLWKEYKNTRKQSYSQGQYLYNVKVGVWIESNK